MIVSVACALCITILECFAMSKGLDGTSLSLAIGAIAGLGGYTVANIINEAKKKGGK
jgi:tRNA A22 N-methylase